MNEKNQDYYCMRDLYLELLWAAQKVEDQRLTELILRRLKDTAMDLAPAPASTCDVIPFPGLFIQHAGHEVVRMLWPKRPLRHMLSMIGGYLAVVLFFAFFGIA